MQYYSLSLQEIVRLYLRCLSVYFSSGKKNYKIITAQTNFLKS